MRKRDVIFIVRVKGVPITHSDTIVRDYIAETLLVEAVNFPCVNLYNEEFDKEYHCAVTIKKVQQNA